MPHSTAYRIIQGAVLAIILGALVHVFIIDSYIIRGDSMAPGLLAGDVVFVNKLSYSRSVPPEREDIVVGHFRTLDATVIKRVVALPPEWVTVTPTSVLVEIGREGAPSAIDDTLYIQLPGEATNGATTTYRLDPYEYYVLGDNRAISEDSRVFGPVDGYNIKGKVIARFRLGDFSILFY